MSAADVAASWQEDPAVARWFVGGLGVGAGAAFTGMLIGGLVGGLGLGASLGLAAFVAFWGGLGFGGMMGGVAGLIREERRDRPEGSPAVTAID